MIGYEDEPARSAEICICEIFGRDVGPLQARIGMGVHPFGDPAITDEFAAETVAIDARASHTYAVQWTPDDVAFYVDERTDQGRPPVTGLSDAVHAQHLRVPRRARGRLPPADRYPKTFVVERFRGYRPIAGPGARPCAFPAAGTA